MTIEEYQAQSTYLAEAWKEFARDAMAQLLGRDFAEEKPLKRIAEISAELADAMVHEFGKRFSVGP